MRYADYQSTEIPWVISIPSHWNQIRNGGIFDYHQDKVGSQFANYDLLSLTTQGIRRKDIHDTTGKVPASFEGYQEVNQGDMVFFLFHMDSSISEESCCWYFETKSPKTPLVGTTVLK